MIRAVGAALLAPGRSPEQILAEIRAIMAAGEGAAPSPAGLAEDLYVSQWWGAEHS
jgi:hypothetical protein